MDVIYTDKNNIEQGVIIDCEIDMEIGGNFKNNFELATTTNNNFLEKDCRFYIEGTEIGGIVDDIKVNTSKQSLVYVGRTIHGVINSKVICPDSGQDYYIVSGDANAILKTLINRLGLSSIITVPNTNSGITITDYEFERYVKGYIGILAMLESVNAKLVCRWSNGKVNMYASLAKDYSEDEEWDSSQLNFKIERKRKTNHLLCLGKGELKNRVVAHLYLNNQDEIVDNQYYTNLDEVIEVYENTGSDTVAKLKKEGTKKFEELLKTFDKCENSLEDSDIYESKYDIGDIVGAYEEITKTSVIATISKKVIKIEGDIITVDCEV